MLNKAILMGRLTDNPELRRTPTDVTVTTFTLAVNRSYVKRDAERQTDFIDIVAWRQTAEFVCKYFKKGQLVAVEGSIQTRSYEDKNGVKRKVVEIVADAVHFCESKSQSGSGNYETQGRPSDAIFEVPTAFENGDVSGFSELEGDDDLPF